MHLRATAAPGAGAVSYGLVCLELEAADSGWRTFVSVQGSLAMSAIHKYGSEEQKQRWLPGMAKGELIGCFALTEPQGGSDPAAMTTTARRDGDGWVIDGAKRWIGLASARRRRRRLGAGRRPDGPGGAGRCAAGVPRADHDARVHRDPDRGQAVDARVGAVRHRPSRASASPPTPCCPRHPDSPGPFGCLNEARYGIVWGAMGAARVVLEAALERSREREVFGKPIGANQLTQAKLADMLLELEKGILLALHLGRLKERGQLRPPRSRSASSTACARPRDRARGAHDPRRRRHHERVPGHAARRQPRVGAHLRGHRRDPPAHPRPRLLTGLNAF